MCESNVYIVESGEEKVLMKEVAMMTPTQNGYEFVDIYGKKMSVENVEIAYIDFLNHKVVLRRKK